MPVLFGKIMVFIKPCSMGAFIQGSWDAQGDALAPILTTRQRYATDGLVPKRPDFEQGLGAQAVEGGVQESGDTSALNRPEAADMEDLDTCRRFPSRFPSLERMLLGFPGGLGQSGGGHEPRCRH